MWTSLAYVTTAGRVIGVFTEEKLRSQGDWVMGRTGVPLPDCRPLSFWRPHLSLGSHMWALCLAAVLSCCPSVLPMAPEMPIAVAGA